MLLGQRGVGLRVIMRSDFLHEQICVARLHECASRALRGEFRPIHSDDWKETGQENQMSTWSLSTSYSEETPLAYECTLLLCPTCIMSARVCYDASIYYIEMRRCEAVIFACYFNGIYLALAKILMGDNVRSAARLNRERAYGERSFKIIILQRSDENSTCAYNSANIIPRGVRHNVG